VTAGRVVFAVAAWLYLAGVVTQVFLAGAGLFELTDWTAHTGLGWGLGTAPLLLLILAFLARPERTTILLTIGLTVAAIVQPELAAARHDDPIIAAFHPVNALLVFWLAWLIARRSIIPLAGSWRGGRGRTAATPSDGSASAEPAPAGRAPNAPQTTSSAAHPVPRGD
jgi:hypothetical protein